MNFVISARKRPQTREEINRTIIRIGDYATVELKTNIYKKRSNKAVYGIFTIHKCDSTNPAININEPHITKLSLMECINDDCVVAYAPYSDFLQELAYLLEKWRVIVPEPIQISVVKD